MMGKDFWLQVTSVKRLRNLSKHSWTVESFLKRVEYWVSIMWPQCAMVLQLIIVMRKNSLVIEMFGPEWRAHEEVIQRLRNAWSDHCQRTTGCNDLELINVSLLVVEKSLLYDVFFFHCMSMQFGDTRQWSMLISFAMILYRPLGADQWGTMVACHDHSWWRWWSHTLWVTLIMLWPFMSCWMCNLWGYDCTHSCLVSFGFLELTQWLPWSVLMVFPCIHILDYDPVCHDYHLSVVECSWEGYPRWYARALEHSDITDEGDVNWYEHWNSIVCCGIQVQIWSCSD